MSYEPPPNPADWLCGADLSGLVSDSADGPWKPPQRREERMTWSRIRPALRRMERARQLGITPL
jgi:hypothetical protein